MNTDNLNIYNQVRAVPKEALREIQAGRLKGKSDINPMWRMKTLTELFGPCGIGWKYTITNKWLERADNGEIAAFVDINLYIKHNNEWSEAIPGTGGSSFVANENRGPYVNDECFKMALTDAISVSCKALGVGADVYWEKDSTKYSPNKPAGTGQGNQSGSKPQANTGQNKPPAGQSDGPSDKEFGAMVDAMTQKTCTDPTCKTPKTVLAPEVIEYSTKKFGMVLCRYCQGKHKSA